MHEDICPLGKTAPYSVLYNEKILYKSQNLDWFSDSRGRTNALKEKMLSRNNDNELERELDSELKS